jgi:hypothetical protein
VPLKRLSYIRGLLNEVGTHLDDAATNLAETPDGPLSGAVEQMFYAISNLNEAVGAMLEEQATGYRHSDS